MVLTFLRVLIVFTVSSFEFQRVRLSWLHRQWPIHLTWMIRYGAMLESYH